MTYLIDRSPISAFKTGIEIECNTSESKATVRSAMRSHGLLVATQDEQDGGMRRADLLNRWRVVSDGSIGTGWELVSPVMGADQYRDQIAAVCNALHDIGATANGRCGLHNHLSGFGSAEFHTVRNVVRRYINFEDTFDRLQPPGRRGSENTYCQSNLRVFDRDPIVATQKIWERIESVHDINGLVRMFNPGSDRYYKVNLCALHRHGTIEIRHHAGTVDFTEIYEWTRFLHDFTNVAMQQIRLWKRPEGHVESPADRLRKLLRGVNPETARYIRSRFLSMSRL